MSTFVNNDVASGNIVYASDHNTQGGLLAAVLNGGIDTANLTDSAVNSNKLAAGAVTNAKTSSTAGELGGAWLTWTPTWTNLTVGNATQRARYSLQGKTVRFSIDLVLGSTSSVANNPQFTFPLALSSNYEVGDPNGAIVANIWFLDASTAEYPGAIRAISTTVGLVNVYGAATTYVNFQAVTASIPFTFGTGDKIFITGSYETP